MEILVSITFVLFLIIVTLQVNQMNKQDQIIEDLFSLKCRPVCKSAPQPSKPEAKELWKELEEALDELSSTLEIWEALSKKSTSKKK